MHELRVLTVTNTYPRRSWSLSSGLYVAQLIEALHAQAVNSDVYVIRGREGAWRYVTAPIAIAARRLQADYDLVHAHHGVAAATVASWPTPFVVTYHGSDVNKRWQRAVSRWAGRRAARRLVVSCDLGRRLGLDPFDVVPCGVDTVTFAPRPREEARSALGWDPLEAYIIFPGNPQRRVKNYPLFRAVVDHVRRTGCAVSTLAMDGSIAHERLPLIFAAADVMLMTSMSEGSPQAVKEALACGLPVVSTDVGDVSQLIDGVTPSRVCEANVDALTEAVIQILAHRQRSNGPQRLRRAGLDWKDVAHQVRQIYDEILQRRSPQRAVVTAK